MLTNKTNMQAKNNRPRVRRRDTARTYTGWLRPRLGIKICIVFACIVTFIMGVNGLRSHLYGEPLVVAVEAETMALPPGGSILADRNAGGASAVKLSTNGTALGSVVLPRKTTGLQVTTRGDQCKGAPNMTVAVDGKHIQSASITSTSWSNYQLPAALEAGSHELAVSFTNDNVAKNCSRNLYIDSLTFTGPEVTAPYTFKHLPDPERTQVFDASGALVATFTNGSRTVVLKGVERIFSEPAYTAATIRTTDYIRLYPQPFSGSVDEAWLSSNLADTSPDIFQKAMQYIDQAPEIKNDDGLRIADDANYGPLLSDGSRQEGSDFNDYLGIPWTYDTGIDNPETLQYGSLDCSGFMRMLWGYRSGLPLSLGTDGGQSIPRRAYQIYDAAPGVVIIANNGSQVTDFSKLQPGDIVFQDANTDDGTQIDHLGMYIGLDSNGNHRFISSRKKANGPTIGDYGGAALLDGKGLYAQSFRAVRRF